MSAPKRDPNESTSTSFGTFLKTVAEPRRQDPDALMARILAALRSGEKPVAALVDVADGSFTRLDEALARLVRFGFVSEDRTPDGVAYKLTRQGEEAAAKQR